MSNFGELVLVLGDLHIPCRTSKIPYQFQRMLVPNKMQHVICTGNLTSNDIYEQLKSLAPNVHIVSGDYDEHLLSNNNNTNNTSSSDMMNDPNNNNNNSGNTGAFQPGGVGGFGGVGGGPPSFPETRIVRVGSFRIGIIHGHQIIPSVRSNRSTTNSSSNNNNNKNGDINRAGTSSSSSKDGNHHDHHDHHDGISKIRRCKFPDADIVITGNTHKNEVMLLSQHDSTPYYHINPGSITGAHTAKSLANSSNNGDVTPSFILLAVQDTKIVCYVYELINDEVEVSKTEINKKQLQQQQQQVHSNNNENPALLQSLLK